MMTDPIADFLTRIKNAQARKHEFVRAPYSNFKMALAKVLEKNGYIGEIEVGGKTKSQQYIKFQLKYDELGRPAVMGAKKVSKLGQRMYIKKENIKTQVFILSIISTSRGLMSDKEARKAGLGGELICKIW